VTVSAGQVPTASEWNNEFLAGTLIGRARHASSNSTGSASTTLVPFLRLDDIPITAGRAYHILTSNMNVDASVADDVAQITITYTTDGSTPTIASSVMPGGTGKALIRNISHPELILISTVYVPSGNETLSLLLSLARATGTGTVLALGTSPDVLEVKVFDAGVDPGDTGVDL